KGHVRRDGGDDHEIDGRGVAASRVQGLPARGKRDVRHRLVVSGDPPFADPGALQDPLVGRVHKTGKLLVSDDAGGNVRSEACDRDRTTVRRPDHDWSTAKVSSPRTASWPSTVARTLPLPTGPRAASRSHSSVSTSPGRTIRLKRTASIPAKSAIRPRFCSSEST